MEIEPYNIIRMMVVVISGLSIYFGYRLFTIVTERQGRLKVAQKESALELSDVGPGVFFSLFGTIVLVAVLWTQPYKQTEVKDGTSGTVSSVRSPASVVDFTENSMDDSQGTYVFNYGLVCVRSDSLEHFRDGISLLDWLSERIGNEPYGELNDGGKKMMMALLQGPSGGGYRALASDITLNADAYNLVSSYLILYSLQNHC